METEQYPEAPRAVPLREDIMRSRRVSRRSFLTGAAALGAAGLVGLPERLWRPAWANAGATTVARTIVGTGGTYQRLAYGAGEPHLLREDLGVVALPGRETRRLPLLYFAQLSDTHVVDAQSPARFEYLDPVAIGGSYPASSAFRPQEMLTPFVLDSMVRQLNLLRTSELSGAPLAFAINTGDTTDNRQWNELRWLIDILDGGHVTPRSGGAAYEGVQQGNMLPYYYHPNRPMTDAYGRRHAFPRYPGLLESAEAGFSAVGLAVPWYAVLGNHDGLVQGTVPALGFLQRLAVGPVKIVAFPFGLEQRARFTRDLLRGDPSPWRQLLGWAESRRADATILVTPDPTRRLISHQEWISDHFTTRGQPVGHGFTQQNLETNTGYYTFDPAPGVHGVVLDTVNPGGGPNGNLDQAQFDWLAADLAANVESVTLVFAHHSVATMDNTLPRPNDPNAPRLGADLEQLLWAHPNVVAFVNGHTHRNTVIPHPNPGGPSAGFWEVNTAAHIDWPEQSRLIELFDNADGTLSIFGTVVDHQAAPDAPSLTPEGLAAISRELSYNDPQLPPAYGSGTPLDRNVELLISRPA